MNNTNVIANTSNLIGIINSYNEAGVLFVKCLALIMLILGAATITDLFVTCYNQPLRLLQIGYNSIDPAAHSIVLCKISWFLLNTLRSLSPWYLVLVCVDRFWCSSSSVKIRGWSSVRIANRIILIATLFGPPIFMFIFGLLTLTHMNRLKQIRVRTFNKHQTENLHDRNQNMIFRNTNRHAMRMLLVQCLVIIIMGGPFMPLHDALKIAKDNLLTNVVGYLSVTGSCLSFYLFTLSSSLFRRELIHLFKRFCARHHQVHVNTERN
ncbi:hypothetical protein I4U23_011183 [Adineta vaga]|nr:hypothetical protein I4U23_011183 [Adineta vaga]